MLTGTLIDWKTTWMRHFLQLDVFVWNPLSRGETLDGS